MKETCNMSRFWMLRFSNVFPYPTHRNLDFLQPLLSNDLLASSGQWSRHVCEEQRCAIFARGAQGKDEMIGF